jgi:uncharacterized protein YjbI with pentapeptide repeats
MDRLRSNGLDRYSSARKTGGSVVANKEHLGLIKQKVADWNHWRRENASSRPDLRNADLRGANLRGADLRAAILLNANLNDAILTRANLSGANLNGAHLMRTNLRSANLSGADLSKAVLYATIFAAIDLTSVIGLETCMHRGPSIMDHRTLQRARSLPISFLRGIGLPDALIEHLPALANNEIQYYSCFISYSANDQNFVDRIYADLQAKGIRCWFAPHDLPIGGKLLDEIDDAIRLRDKVLLVLSEQSIDSDWVADEVNIAFEEERRRREIVLFPIRLDDAVMTANKAWAAKLRADRNIGDFRRWKNRDAYKQSVERALRDLTRSPNVS